MPTPGTRSDATPIGQLILGGLLLAWHPLSAMVHIATDVGALPIRGIGLAFGILARLLVVGVGVGAGITLVGRRPEAVRFALTAMVLSGLLDLFVYTTPIFPNNRMPGDTPFYIAGSAAYHLVWIIYLLRATRRESL